jgi:hypothetical protein
LNVRPKVEVRNKHCAVYRSYIEERIISKNKNIIRNSVLNMLLSNYESDTFFGFSSGPSN